MNNEDILKESNELTSRIKAVISSTVSGYKGSELAEIVGSSIATVLAYFCISAIKDEEPEAVFELFKCTVVLSINIIDQRLRKNNDN